VPPAASLYNYALVVLRVTSISLGIPEFLFASKESDDIGIPGDYIHIDLHNMCRSMMFALLFLAVVSLVVTDVAGSSSEGTSRRQRSRRWKRLTGIGRPGTGKEHHDNLDPFRLPLAVEADPFRFTAQPSAAPSHLPSAMPSTRPSHSPTFAPSMPPSPNPTFAPTVDPTSSSPTTSPTTYRWIPDAWRERETNRIPDFSYSGYQLGDREPPSIGTKGDLQWERNVRDYGAVPDDDGDDTEAFRAALADGGRIFVPRGRYIIRHQLVINKSGTVLGGPRGADPPVLYFPQPLAETNPVEITKTAGGNPTSPYSWGGGFIEFKGGSRTVQSARVVVGGQTQPAGRSDILRLEAIPSRLQVGSTVSITLRGDERFVSAAYAGDTGDISNVKIPVWGSFVRRILAVDHERSTVTLGGALPIELSSNWGPYLNILEPTLQEAGLQNLQITFPRTNYRGHHTEVGYNGIVVSGANNWVRDVAIHNADSGIFCYGHANTLQNILLTSSRQSSSYNGVVGHHGITLGGRNNVVNGFDFKATFFHDLTVSNFVNGNVFANGRGVDLAIDHHKRGPFNNLFTSIDAGRGSRLFYSGGGQRLGKYAGTANVYWSIWAKNQLFPPSVDTFGAKGSWFVGIKSEVRSRSNSGWQAWERTDFADPMYPADLYKAQRKERGVTSQM